MKIRPLLFLPLLTALSGCVYIDTTAKQPPPVIYYAPPAPAGGYVPPVGSQGYQPPTQLNPSRG